MTGIFPVVTGRARVAVLAVYWLMLALAIGTSIYVFFVRAL